VHEPFGIARLAYETAGELVARDSFYVARYDVDKKEFDFVLQAEGVQVWAGARYPLGSGPTSQVVLTGETYLVRSVDDPVQRRGMGFGEAERPSASGVHVPLKSRGRLVGVLSSQSYRPGAFDAEDIAVLQSLANLVATAFENAEHHARLRELYLASVRALAAAVEAKDPYTERHTRRVAETARYMGNQMGLPEPALDALYRGGIIHDIGKIGVPDAVLLKPGPLDQEELVHMQAHPLIGESIVKPLRSGSNLLPIIRHHHEHFEGSGYPDGLAGDRIPRLARIVSICDAFDAMVNDRPYRPRRPEGQAIEILIGGAGSQWDPEIVDLFVREMPAIRRLGAA